MTDYRLRVEDLRKKLLLNRFKQELNEYNKYDFDLEEDRKSNLDKIVKVIESGNKTYIKDVKFRDRQKYTQNMYTNKIEDYFTKLDNLVYQRRWNGLKDFHKEKKLEEWVDSQQLSKKIKQSLLKDLLEAFNDKKIHTEKNIEYNIQTMKIESIQSVEIHNKTDSYTVLKKNSV